METWRIHDRGILKRMAAGNAGASIAKLVEKS
jgi:hypothetical protein